MQDKKIEERFFFSSLKQAFTFRVLDRNLFLGLYRLDLKKIKVNRLLKFLINNKILIFSQIYVGNGLGQFKLPISLDFKRIKYKLNFKFYH